MYWPSQKATNNPRPFLQPWRQNGLSHSHDPHPRKYFAEGQSIIPHGV
jgi:hypothetical protein